jgi:integrase
MSSVPKYSVQKFRGGYAVVWRDDDGKRHRESLVASDRQGAEAEARQRWRLGDHGDSTVDAIMGAYLDALEAAATPSATRRRDAWKAMRHYWQDVRPAMIDEPMCRGYDRQRKAGQATRRYELSMLSTALRYAVAQKMIPAAPAIWRPAAPERRERHLTREAFNRFYAEVKAPHARLYMILALSTCARPSALLELTWDRVDFTRRTINLNPPGRTQTAKRRPVVPIADWALQPLLDAYEARQCGNVIERGAKPVASIKKAFSAASARSGVAATPYTLRHTGAVWKAEDGIPMAELSQLMGHDDSATTEKFYARFSPNHLRGAANAGAF